jgi:Restriction endonuclease
MSINLASDFEQLQQLPDSQDRGYRFQEFVAALFQREHFTVERNPGSAKPRQVDLLALRGSEAYVIETKWRKKPANIDDVDSLFTRLDAVPGSTHGVLISYQGFTLQALKRIIERSNRPIIPLTGQEIQKIAQHGGGLRRLLYEKRNWLLVHRQVIIDAARENRHRPARLPTDMANSDWNIVREDGTSSRWFSGKGIIDGFIFVQYPPPAEDYGISAAIPVPIENEDGLVELICRLSDLGWASSAAQWTIQQQTRNWHGFGTRSFVECLVNWSTRYRGLSLHHSEQICFYNEFDGGFFVLDGYVSALNSREVRNFPMLMLHLQGIPLDSSPIHHLCESFGVTESVFFRPNSQSSVTSEFLKMMPRLDVVARLVKPENLYDGRGLTDAVHGVIAKNPYYKGEDCSELSSVGWLPTELLYVEYILCYLRGTHALDEEDITYWLEGVESTVVYNEALIRCTAEWRPKRYQRKRKMADAAERKESGQNVRSYAEIKPIFSQFSPGWPEVGKRGLFDEDL